MTWKQIAFNLEAEACPCLEAILKRAGALAITYLDPGGEPVLEPGVGETPLWPRVRLQALLDCHAAVTRLRAEICDLLGRDPDGWFVETIQDRPWVRAWQDECVPLCFGDRLWVIPTGLEPPDPEAVNLRLDPGLAFGSGTHPSTALCLEWLDEHEPVDLSVVDYGCGSGILAVAALCLGARVAYGVDTDIQALLASRNNAKRNGVSARLQLFAAEQPLSVVADVVLANILARTLRELAPRLTNLTRPGGMLVLAGILREQVDPVMDSFAGAFRFEPPRLRDEWACLIGLRQSIFRSRV